MKQEEEEEGRAQGGVAVKRRDVGRREGCEEKVWAREINDKAPCA